MLVIRDYFIRQVETFLLTDKQAVAVAEVLASEWVSFWSTTDVT